MNLETQATRISDRKCHIGEKYLRLRKTLIEWRKDALRWSLTRVTGFYQLTGDSKLIVFINGETTAVGKEARVLSRSSFLALEKLS